MSNPRASNGKGLASFMLVVLTSLSLTALPGASSGHVAGAARGYGFAAVSCTSSGTSTDRPNGRPPLHPNGTLVRVSGSSTVYLIDGGRKRGIPSQTVLNSLYTNGGFNNNDVITISSDELSQYSPGSDVSGTMQGNGRAQPDGRLISNGSEVSIVTNSGGRRPFSSSTRFQSLGYQFCNVVTLTPADYNSYQPVGMAVGDYPAPASPSNGSAGQSLTPTLTWASVSGVSVYRVQIATSLSALPSSPYFTECFGCTINQSTSSTSYTPSAGALAPNTQYFWQIQAVNFPDQSVWSAVWSFTTMATPPVIRIAPTTLNFSQTGTGATASAAPSTELAGTGTTAAAGGPATGTTGRPPAGAAGPARVIKARLASGPGPSASLASTSQAFSIFNDGGTTLHVSGITEQNNSVWLSIDASTTPPFDIAPGASVSVNVVVNTAGLGAGSYSDRLLVASNDTARSPYPSGVFVNLSVTPPCQSVSAVSPTSGQVGTAVTISGSNFTGVSAVRFGNVTASFSVDDDTHITTAVPQGAVTGPITVGKSGCGDAQTGTFTVNEPPPPTPPTVTTTAAHSITNTAATLGGSVNPNGSDTTAWFEWGTDAALSAPNSTAAQPIGAGDASQPVEANLTGLVPNTVYFFRAVGSNDASTVRGSILSFSTTADDGPRIDSVTPQAGRSSGGQQIKLTGSFENLYAVTVGGASASWTFSGGTGEITVTTPPHAVGAVAIEVATASGAAYSKDNAFAYLPTSFTDDPLVAGVTRAKAQHVLELRQAVDALRAVAGLPQAQWTEPVLVNFITPVRLAHVNELRTNLEDAAAALGYARASYTDPTLGAGSVIKRVHIEELRLRIKALAGECPRCLL